MTKTYKKSCWSKVNRPGVLQLLKTFSVFSRPLPGVIYIPGTTALCGVHCSPELRSERSSQGRCAWLALQLPFDLSFFAIHFQFQLISDDALLLWGAMQFLNRLLRLCSTWFFLSVYSQGRDDLGMEVLLDAIQTCGSWKFLVILWNKMKQVASSSSAQQTCDIMWLTEAYRAKVVPLWWSRKRHSVDSAQLVLKHNILNLWGEEVCELLHQQIRFLWPAPGGENSEKLAAARILAKDVLDSFTAMREYLREDRASLMGGVTWSWLSWLENVVETWMMMKGRLQIQTSSDTARFFKRINTTLGSLDMTGEVLGDFWRC